ncbi:ribonuclease P protein subunit p40 [Cephus cinctus]|uniref:Ribonuclease P protein subunit p40 n=1 Tax=Cephus cinctus TaxID=211228 RepID=A0AAJ7C7R2_CEPCN|nr:ribonuclease P protein subunit p40 [Cephus cinctus]
MLCPEVWDFKAPQHYFKVEHANYLTKDLPVTIKTHYFNHSVSVVLPDTVSIPEDLPNSLLEDTDYYRIEALNTSELVCKEFIEAFIKKGELSLLSIGKKIDLHNSIAITPTGHLIISLVHEDFQKLGLEGTPSFFDRKVQTRHVVTIDLKEENFTPGKKNYERVRESLEKRLPEKFVAIVAWDPPDEKLCPSSIGAWFHSRGYSVSLCQQKFIRRSEYSIKVPIIEEHANYDKLFEWLGVFSIGGDLVNGKDGDYVNTYQCPEPAVLVGQVQYLQWTGFFTRKQIENIYKVLTNYTRTRERLPWSSLDVQGFEDCPVSWRLKEHTFTINGDNSYTMILQPSGEYLLRTSLCSNNKSRAFQ